MLIDYKASLNSSQYEAVNSFYGPMLCLAGAGSGKTRTLVFRAAKMIESGISPGSILLLTFTRKAAQKMLSRVYDIVGESAELITGGTYHSFAISILKSCGCYIGVEPNFTVIDTADSAEIINLLAADLGFNRPNMGFPSPKKASEIFSMQKNLCGDLGYVLSRFYKRFEPYKDCLAELQKKYEEYKKRNNIFDYDGLLTLLDELLQNSPDAKNAVNARYSFVMADEYQDTSLIQAKITLMLGGRSQNIMVVGDDSQSIYSFRGAAIQNIIDFPKAFSSCRVIRLEENYRSTASILNAANAIISKASEGFKKTLYTKNEAGALPVAARCQTEQDQADFVVKRVKELRAEGVKLSDIAVLFRFAQHSLVLEAKLNSSKIPYVKWGGTKFCESKHIKDITAYLRIVLNPYDQIAWLRVLRLISGVGPKTALQIYEHVCAASSPYDFSGFSASKSVLEALGLLSNMLRAVSALAHNPPAKALEIITDFYFPIIKSKYEDYAKRFKDIDQIFIVASNFSSTADFLTSMVLEPPLNGDNANLANGGGGENDALVLSTIHSAKGQEWHSVFIINALEGRFPPIEAANNPQELEEERRLMYVAVTRAKRNLYITYPTLTYDQRLGQTLYKKSRFIDDIPKRLYETWQVV